MINWDDNMVKLLIYLVYGTIFIAMSLVLTLWRKRITNIEFMNDFGSLVIFALLQGLSGYCEIPRFLNLQPAWVYDILKLILASSSFAALFSFGLNVASAGIEENRWLRGIPHGALMMYFWFLTFMGSEMTSGNSISFNYNVADLVQRQSLGFLGAVVTSYAFFELSDKLNTIVGANAGKKFIYAGVGFALYAIFIGFIVNPVLGIPAIFFSCVIALFLTIVIINIFELFEVKKPG
ncbi:MAG TPA: hypothetical protein VF354_05490 [Candidatus Methanoperedens sp.]